MSSWFRLDRGLYAGPVVRARIHDLDVDHRRREAEPDTVVHGL